MGNSSSTAEAVATTTAEHSSTASEAFDGVTTVRPGQKQSRTGSTTSESSSYTGSIERKRRSSTAVTSGKRNINFFRSRPVYSFNQYSRSTDSARDTASIPTAAPAPATTTARSTDSVSGIPGRTGRTTSPVASERYPLESGSAVGTQGTEYRLGAPDLVASRLVAEDSLKRTDTAGRPAPSVSTAPPDVTDSRPASSDSRGSNSPYDSSPCNSRAFNDSAYSTSHSGMNSQFSSTYNGGNSTISYCSSDPNNAFVGTTTASGNYGSGSLNIDWLCDYSRADNTPPTTVGTSDPNNGHPRVIRASSQAFSTSRVDCSTTERTDSPGLGRCCSAQLPRQTTGPTDTVDPEGVNTSVRTATASAAGTPSLPGGSSSRNTPNTGSRSIDHSPDCSINKRNCTVTTSSYSTTYSTSYSSRYSTTYSTKPDSGRGSDGMSQDTTSTRTGAGSTGTISGYNTASCSSMSSGASAAAPSVGTADTSEPGEKVATGGLGSRGVKSTSHAKPSDSGADPIAQGEEYRKLGNDSYHRGFMETAIDYYSKAILLNPTLHTYYTNRALCYMKLANWKKCIDDCRQALNVEENSVKAHYFLGKALLETGDASEGLKKLIKAKTLSSSSRSSYEEQIIRTIRKARKQLWFREQQAKREELNELKGFINNKMAKLRELGDIGEEEFNSRSKQLDELFNKSEESTKPGEIPDYLCCRISMGIIKDPVCTPSGLSYEKELLMEHLQKNGQFDPVTREACAPARVTPNYSLKEATEHFLERNPWAFDEDYMDTV